MRLHKYTEEELRVACAESESIREALQKLNVAAYGGNYEIFKKAVTVFDIDISHFSGKGKNKGKFFGPKRNIEEYLSNSAGILSFKLKNRLIKEGIFEKRCSCCGLTEWNNLPIPLELDHINGTHSDNTLSNLRILCPNCHAQTDNYRGKNKRKKN